MSRSEYQERQRKQDLSDTNTLDCGEDASTLGFSLGSVQSAPALGGLGLSLTGNGGGGGGCGGAGSGAGGVGGRRAVSGGAGSRGTSITAFENVNPFEGGIRVATSTPPKIGGTAGGDLSPLSTSVGGQNGRKFFSAAGPETSSVGEEDDPHLALVKVGPILLSGGELKIAFACTRFSGGECRNGGVYHGKRRRDKRGLVFVP